MYKIQEYQSGCGLWRVCAPDEKGARGKWYFPARMLKMSLTDWIQLLINDYNASNFAYCAETDCLVYGFKNYADCHKFVLWINRVARKENW